MADKRLDQVTKVTNMAYVPVIMSDGSIGQIAKANLATVVAEQMGNPVGNKGDIVDANNCITSGIYRGRANNLNTPEAYGVLVVYLSLGYIVQNFYAPNSIMYTRYSTNSSTWSSWSRIDNFGYNTLAELSEGVAEKEPLNGVNDGVFIMFHRNSDNYPLMVKPNKWASYQDSGEIAEGVVVVEGGKILVVAPTETSLCWSSASVSAGGTTTSDRLTALDDWAGKESTEAQITHPECSSASYAPGFCAQYSRVNANGKGLTSGRWWLPSVGELMMIYSNMNKINYALSLINNATQLGGTIYWSSTEYTTANAWNINLYYGAVLGSGKASSNSRVRPVSAFLY